MSFEKLRDNYITHHSGNLIILYSCFCPESPTHHGWQLLPESFLFCSFQTGPCLSLLPTLPLFFLALSLGYTIRELHGHILWKSILFFTILCSIHHKISTTEKTKILLRKLKENKQNKQTNSETGSPSYSI